MSVVRSSLLVVCCLVCVVCYLPFVLNICWFACVACCLWFVCLLVGCLVFALGRSALFVFVVFRVLLAVCCFLTVALCCLSPIACSSLFGDC